MDKKWVVGDTYVWTRPDGSEVRVILKSEPRLPADNKWVGQGEQRTYPDPKVLQCEVEVLPNRGTDFAPVSELSPAP